MPGGLTGCPVEVSLVDLPAISFNMAYLATVKPMMGWVYLRLVEWTLTLNVTRLITIKACITGFLGVWSTLIKAAT